ncbi:hypothetical protein [Mesorhizobium sp.]|uniref:hypothetical protein n=1 Tax=Mesorhizobium sp. TaxID=1871066 RepID=UPI0025802DB2|nr:hypothetical protein [Mesorhizobium sp.]
MSQGFSGNPAATTFGSLVAGPGFDVDAAAVGAAFAAGLAAAGFAPPFADTLAFAGTAAAFGLALAVGAFSLSGLAGFAAGLALAVAGAVVLGVFATRPSLDCSYCLCLLAASPPNDRDVLRCCRHPGNPACHLCIATIGSRASLPLRQGGKKSSAAPTSRRSQFLTNAGLKINKKMQSLTLP